MYFKDQPVLVTGASGLVGTHLVTRLLREGAIVRATLHQNPAVVTGDCIEYIQGDLTVGENCRKAVQGVRYIFHFAAVTSGAGIISTTPMIHVTPNILMNAQMLEAAYGAQVEKFLWLSSTTGYPPSGNRPVKETEMFEGEPYDKYFFGGWMKRFTEVLCQMYGEKLPQPMTTIVLRPSNIYGPNDDFEPATSHVTPALIRKVVERQNPIEVWGTGDDVRDLIYVDDVVEAIVKAMERVESHTAINIGLGRGYRVKEILQMILELDDYTDATVVFNPSKPTMIPIRLLDVAKAKSVLGFEAKTDLRLGLAKTITWYRATQGIPNLCTTFEN